MESYGYGTEAAALIGDAITVTAGTINTTGPFLEANVAEAKTGRLRANFVRNSANVSPITFFFAGIGDPTEGYPHIPSFEITFDLSHEILPSLPGAPVTTVRVDRTFDVSGYYAIKLLGIKNAGATDLGSLDADLTYKR